MLWVDVKKPSVGHESLNTICYVLCLFSDRAGSISTLDSLDFARYSDDGNRESDERVAGKTNPTVEIIATVMRPQVVFDLCMIFNEISISIKALFKQPVNILYIFCFLSMELKSI